MNTVQILSLTAILIDGCVNNLILCYHTIGLCWFRPTQLSDSWANDIEGQAAWFTWDCTEERPHRDGNSEQCILFHFQT